MADRGGFEGCSDGGRILLAERAGDDGAGVLRRAPYLAADVLRVSKTVRTVGAGGARPADASARDRPECDARVDGPAADRQAAGAGLGRLGRRRGQHRSLVAPGRSRQCPVVSDHSPDPGQRRSGEPQPRERPRSSFKRFVASEANGCRQMDGKDRPPAGGTIAKVLRVQSDCSRKIMAGRAAWSENTTDAWACMETAMDRHGRPAMFLSDGGSAFT